VVAAVVEHLFNLVVLVVLVVAVQVELQATQLAPMESQAPTTSAVVAAAVAKA
jgi:hypothetical protein